jgi:hypothetical protein
VHSSNIPADFGFSLLLELADVFAVREVRDVLKSSRDLDKRIR